MRNNVQRLSLLLIFLVVAFAAWAELSDYSFTQSTSAYTEITGGTILGTNENNQESFNAIPLGFAFTFNEVEYTEISVQNDGFIAFGSTVAQSNTAISSATGTNNLAVAFNRDLKSKDDGSLSYTQWHRTQPYFHHPMEKLSSRAHQCGKRRHQFPDSTQRKRQCHFLPLWKHVIGQYHHSRHRASRFKRSFQR